MVTWRGELPVLSACERPRCKVSERTGGPPPSVLGSTGIPDNALMANSLVSENNCLSGLSYVYQSVSHAMH